MKALPGKGRASLRSRRPYRLEGAFEISSRKVVADVKQRTGIFLGDFIGEAVAEIQPCRMRISSPLRTGCSDPACRGGGYRQYLKAEPTDHMGHFFSDVAPSRDDQGFRRKSRPRCPFPSALCRHQSPLLQVRSPSEPKYRRQSSRQTVWSIEEVLASCGAFSGACLSGPGGSYRFKEPPACVGGDGGRDLVAIVSATFRGWLKAM
jgi:hypothetical protein